MFSFQEHDDFRGLKIAREAMFDVADYINEVQRDSEQLEIIRKVEDCIVDLNLPGGNDLKQYGRLIHDGELQISWPSSKNHEDHREKTRYAFMFHKILIIVKKMPVSLFMQNSLWRFLFILFLHRNQITRSVTPLYFRISELIHVMCGKIWGSYQDSGFKWFW